VISTYLRRGLAAGLLAGLLAGLFAFFVGEPLLDRAIALEESAAHAHGEGAHAHGEEDEAPFGRTAQKVGLFFATGLSGVFVGGLFGLVFAYFRGPLATGSDWNRSLTLAAALFVGVALIPFLKYPANPPSVGDPETIGVRTIAYFGLVAISLITLLIAWQVYGMLRERGVSLPVRQVAVGLGAVVVVAVLYRILPPSADPGRFPAGLLWDFRLSSLGTQLVLWTGLGLLFGALCERAGSTEELV
jgi:predicted cobalt transporter CbtA